MIQCHNCKAILEATTIFIEEDPDDTRHILCKHCAAYLTGGMEQLENLITQGENHD